MSDTNNNINNADRACRLDEIISRYSDDSDSVANLIDMLADARHWCDRNGQCYGDLDRVAYNHYLAEL
jgi:hypothetical protein